MTDFELATAADLQLMQGLAQRVTADCTTASDSANFPATRH